MSQIESAVTYMNLKMFDYHLSYILDLQNLGLAQCHYAWNVANINLSYMFADEYCISGTQT